MRDHVEYGRVLEALVTTEIIQQQVAINSEGDEMASCF